MLSLNELWFIIIAVLFVGFFVLEGFDFGVGIVSRFLGENDLEKRIYLNTIGPFWHANEVWLVCAGGAMFAAFRIGMQLYLVGFTFRLYLCFLL